MLSFWADVYTELHPWQFRRTRFDTDFETTSSRTTALQHHFKVTGRILFFTFSPIISIYAKKKLIGFTYIALRAIPQTRLFNQLWQWTLLVIQNFLSTTKLASSVDVVAAVRMLIWYLSTNHRITAGCRLNFRFVLLFWNNLQLRGLANRLN